MCAVYQPQTNYNRYDDAKLESIQQYDSRLVPGVTVFWSTKNWILRRIFKYPNGWTAEIENGDDLYPVWLHELEFVCYFNDNDVECVE